MVQLSLKFQCLSEENIDNVDKKLNKLFTSLRSKYYLFVSDPVVIGIDAIEGTRVILTYCRNNSR